MRTAIFSCLVLPFIAGCALQLVAQDETITRVDDGIHAIRLATRMVDDTALTPARVSFIAGPRGVVVLDSGLSARNGEAILAAVEREAHAPVRLLVLTHPSQEAIFGASAFAARGIPVAAGREAATLMAARCPACLERLRAALGNAAMAGTQLVTPGRLLDDGDILQDIGRPLRVIAPVHSSAPGALALLDEATGTVFAGSMVLVHAIPDIRDGDLEPWRAALERVSATGCRHLVPAFGPIGSCHDVPAFRAYLDDLESHVAELRARGAELGDMEAMAGLPRYAGWERYGDRHRANAERMFLRLEQEEFAHP